MKILFTIFILTLSTGNVKSAESSLESKYEEFSKLVNQDISFIKTTIASMETNYVEEEILDQIIKEVKEQKKLNINPTNKISTRASSLGTALPGAIFYYPAYTSGVNHGHNGIYTKNDEIAEAPGGSNLTRLVPVNIANFSPGETKVYIVNVATTEQKNLSAAWARRMALKARPYNDAFWSNKSCNDSDNYNCSQLVWCAYNDTSNIDLDSNLGFGVYPSDIIASGKLTYAATY
ncbi:MAG: hypothetical protein RSB77_01410 [Bacilli bacterium]